MKKWLIIFLILNFNLFGQFIAQVPDTLLLCNGQNLKLSISAPYDSIFWSNGTSSDTLLINSTGQYWFSRQVNGFIISDSFYVKSNNSQVIPSSDYFNTANNGNGGKILVGNDLHWEFSDESIYGPYVPATVVSNPTSAWYTSSWPSSDWIAGSNTGYHLITSDTTYYFRNEFSLPCANDCGQSPIDSGNFCLDLEFFADNYVAEIYVNGVPQFNKNGLIQVASPYNYIGYANGFQRSIMLCGDFRTGINEIIVVVRSSPYAYGFLCQANPSLLNPITPIIDTVGIYDCGSVFLDGIEYTRDTVVLSFTLDSNNNCIQTFKEIDIYPEYVDTIYTESCSPLFWEGMTIDSSGIYAWVGQTEQGCDSTIWNQFTRLYQDTTGLAFFGCDSLYIDSYWFKSDTTFWVSDTNRFGCDSLINFSIDISNSYVDSTAISSCTPIIFLGLNLIQTGWYTKVLSSLNGCDSTVHIHFQFLLNDSVSVITYDCDSTYVSGLGWLNQSYSTVDTLINQYGCDSIVVRDRIVSYSKYSGDSISSCTPILWNGQQLTISGIYYDTLLTSNGCDSIQWLQFNKNPTYLDTISIASCDSVFAFGKVFLSNTNYLDSTITRDGCDSLTYANIRVWQSSIGTVDILEGCYFVEYDGQIHYEADTIRVVYSNQNGCDSSHTVFLNVNFPEYNILSDTITSCYDNIEELIPDSLVWVNPEILMPKWLLDTVVILNVKTVSPFKNCGDTIIQYVRVESCDYSIWIPNSFTPNNDGVNDDFEIVSRNLTDFEIRIFDRWGKIVFQSSDSDFKYSPSQSRAAIQEAYTFKLSYRFWRANGMKSKVHNIDGIVFSIQ